MALGVGGLGGWDGGWLGGAPHTRAHAPTCTHAHACVVNMIIPCKWLLPLDFGEIPGIPYDVIHVCACVRACTCMCVAGILSPPFTPIHPPPIPLGWGTPGISQNSIALELIEIFQFCLKIWNLWRLPTHGWVYNFMGGWVGVWVDGWGQVKSLKI